MGGCSRGVYFLYFWKKGESPLGKASKRDAIKKIGGLDLNLQVKKSHLQKRTRKVLKERERKKAARRGGVQGGCPTIQREKKRGSGTAPHPW